LLSLTWDKIDLEGGTILIMSACKVGRDNNSSYFITWRGKPVKRIVSGAFETAKRKSEIDPNRKLPPYFFRQVFVTAALNADGDLKSVSERQATHGPKRQHGSFNTPTSIYIARF
jgi:hypothetical protein